MASFNGFVLTTLSVDETFDWFQWKPSGEQEECHWLHSTLSRFQQTKRLTTSPSDYWYTLVESLLKVSRAVESSPVCGARVGALLKFFDQNYSWKARQLSGDRQKGWVNGAIVKVRTVSRCVQAGDLLDEAIQILASIRTCSCFSCIHFCHIFTNYLNFFFKILDHL